MNKNIELNKTKLEIHYYFSDSSHSIDAEIYLSNLKNVLDIIKTVSSTFKIIHKVEIEPAEEGGFNTFITVIEEKARTYPIITGLLVSSVSFMLSNATEPLFDNVFKSSIVEESEKIDLEIKKLELEEKTIEVENKKLI